MKHKVNKSMWVDQVQRWLQSGKSAKAWCREHKLVYNTFLGWYHRLQADKKSLADPENLITEPQFIELKEQPPASSGIILECAGVLVHVSEGFNPLTLKNCLHVLRGG
jgi:transposase-like protein